MVKCTGCRKDQSESEFKNGDKITKKCLTCRNWAKAWREKNKKRVSEYNKNFNKQHKNGKMITVVYGKPKDSDKWIKYESQHDAAKKLGLCTPNINKVINGSLNTTGGYVFKTKQEKFECELETWENVKEKNGFEDNVKGKPSVKRLLHEIRKDTIGKICCTCKEWKSLNNFNKSKSHWDKLRNDCKTCLAVYRKKNRKMISKMISAYEKKRKLIDPNFKLRKTLRSRIGSALHKIKAKKHMDTMSLTGCTITELKKYLEEKFDGKMTWDNHGEWHIDHIIPCASWDLTNPIHQYVCFNYRNLQPMWQKANLEKSNKYDEKDRKKLVLGVTKCKKIYGIAFC
jgi:hypothetical protein